MAFPIKYMENNLVFNQNGECYAYYELEPYNYSFLSDEQKEVIYDNLKQLISQIPEGNIHFLELGTESSIRRIQEDSKQYAVGKFEQLACDTIDKQTDILLEEVGDSQTDYRSYIGVKLIKTNYGVSVTDVKNNLLELIKEFFSEVNNKLMGDFVSISNSEISRYEKLEKLLMNKITRRFKARRVDKNDLGYIIEHIYGQPEKIYEEYEYHLPIKRKGGKSLVKRYDLLKPTHVLISEKKRHLEIENQKEKVYVTYFVISEIIHELEFLNSEILYAQQEQFSYPVDVSMQVEILPNPKALSIIRGKKKDLDDLDKHAFSSDNDTNSNIVQAIEDTDELNTELEGNKESMYKMSYTVRITASNLEELNKRVDEVKDFYDDYRIKLIRPFGNMLKLQDEFLPSSTRCMNDYVQYVKSDFFASLGFGATQMLGEKNGMYIGYNVQTGKNVYLRLNLASQGVKGSITNALSVAFLGSLGGGKSFANNLMCYFLVLLGAKIIILDPKNERGRWKENLPQIADEINILNLTSEDKFKGFLDPYVIMQNLKDAESLAIDILTLLLGISSRDGKKFPVLKRAISSVSKSEKRGLLLVVEKLRQEDTNVSNDLADHIESFVDYDFAQLLFSDGTVEQSISLDKQLNIIQIADLIMPDEMTALEEYTSKELLSVAMLTVISTFSLDFIQSDRSTFKVVDIDEAWVLLQTPKGKALANKATRAGRSMNAGVYFITQNADDLLDEKMKNNIGLKFAFRSTDINEIKKILTFFNLEVDNEENQKMIRNLENGQCLMQDLYGRVGILQVEYLFDELHHAFDTKPRIGVNKHD